VNGHKLPGVTHLLYAFFFFFLILYNYVIYLIKQLHSFNLLDVSWEETW
jgi:hypothetical protein